MSVLTFAFMPVPDSEAIDSRRIRADDESDPASKGLLHGIGEDRKANTVHPDVAGGNLCLPFIGFLILDFIGFFVLPRPAAGSHLG